MEITITGRNINLDDDLKAYIHKRLDKLERLYQHIYNCEVILEEEKIRKNAEIILHLKRGKIIAKESSPDIYASIDNASENIKKQIRRLKGRLNSRRRRNVFSKFIGRRFRYDEGDASGEIPSGDIIRTNAFANKPMMPEEAKLELELMDRDFIMFKNADTGETNVLYKRSDDNYGLIEPKF